MDLLIDDVEPNVLARLSEMAGAGGVSFDDLVRDILRAAAGTGDDALGLNRDGSATPNSAT